jgi:GTP-binding protein
MKIKSAEFVKGIMGEDDILTDGIPQVAFIGRSNVGKSSVINSFVNRRDLAHSSSTAGRTREVNFFLVNRAFYLVDLPGYGYAKMSLENRDVLRKLIYWYLLYANVDHRKVVLIVDAKVGVTDYDTEVLRRLDDAGKNVVVVANKVDKVKKSAYAAQLVAIQAAVGAHKVIPYSATEKIGIGELVNEVAV